MIDCKQRNKRQIAIGPVQRIKTMSHSEADVWSEGCVSVGAPERPL